MRRELSVPALCCPRTSEVLRRCPFAEEAGAAATTAGVLALLGRARILQPATVLCPLSKRDVRPQTVPQFYKKVGGAPGELDPVQQVGVVQKGCAAIVSSRRERTLCALKKRYLAAKQRVASCVALQAHLTASPSLRSSKHLKYPHDCRLEYGGRALHKFACASVRALQLLCLRPPSRTAQGGPDGKNCCCCSQASLLGASEARPGALAVILHVDSCSRSPAGGLRAVAPRRWCGSGTLPTN